MAKRVRAYVMHPAELRLSTGERLNGEVFLLYDDDADPRTGQRYPLRVADLLNDERQFLPLKIAEGEIRLVNKLSVIDVRLIIEPAAEGSSEADAADRT